jgi:hypothetical protein
MADITYDDVVKLVEQLTPAEQETLIRHLQQHTEEKQRSKDEWKRRFESVVIKLPILEEPSPRREDWYDDER